MISSRPFARFHARSLPLIALALLLGISASALAAEAVSWVMGPSMSVQRYAHAGTLLSDGRLLVTGGYTGPSHNLKATATAEVYDPAAGSWTRMGSLRTARTNHVAVRLADGTILVTGGYDATGNILASVERYHPATGVFTPAADMLTPRVLHTATLLADGRVLVVGGNLPNTQITTAEIYDPATDAWTPTPNLAGPHIRFTATLLTTGQVLVAAGGTPVDPFFSQQAELYDPATGHWSLTGNLSTGREGHTATLLADGKVLVTGGEGPVGHGSGSLSSCELYDSATGQWKATRSLQTAREFHQATILAGGEVLVVAGFADARQHAILGSTEIYDPVRGRWSISGALVLPVEDETTTLLLDGRVLVSGGYNRNGVGVKTVQVGTDEAGE